MTNLAEGHRLGGGPRRQAAAKEARRLAASDSALVVVRVAEEQAAHFFAAGAEGAGPVQAVEDDVLLGLLRAAEGIDVAQLGLAGLPSGDDAEALGRCRFGDARVG